MTLPKDTGLNPWHRRLFCKVVIGLHPGDVLDDYEDAFEEVLRERGRVAARLWCWAQLGLAIMMFVRNTLYRSCAMFWNAFKMSLRQIQKQKGHALIHIFGLALGMVCCLLMILWAADEMGYDRFHKNRAELYKVGYRLEYSNGRTESGSGSFYPLAGVLKSVVPEVLDAVRWDYDQNVLIRYQDIRLTENRIGYVDPSFLKLFSFRMSKGDPAICLTEKYSIVLTRSMARKYFGDEDPMGKTLHLLDQYDVQVTGVLEDVPKQSSLKFDCLMPFLWSLGAEAVEPQHWGGNPLWTFVMLHPKSEPEKVESQITEEALKRIALPEGVTGSLLLVNLGRMHLNGNGGSLAQTLRIFSWVAACILAIAWINFINLTTAHSAGRGLEVGLRKCVGASRADLIRQFMSESLLTVLLTLIMACFLTILVLPVFNNLADRDLGLAELLRLEVLLGFLGVAGITALFAGGIPALALSAFKPIQVLRGALRTGVRSGILRKVLVVSQFTVALFLIIAMMVLTKQMNSIRSKDLGYEKENMLIMRMPPPVKEQYEAVRDELMGRAGVTGVTRSLQNIASIGSSIWSLGWEGMDPNRTYPMNFEFVGYDYFETMGMQIVQGRGFSRELQTDVGSAFILNEAALRSLGLDSPIGLRVKVMQSHGQVVGVVKDFHFEALRQGLGPMVIGLDPDWTDWMYIRIHPENQAQTMETIHSVIRKFCPYHPFNVWNLEDAIGEANYQVEERIGRIGKSFALLAILLSCMGLFGLASFLAVKKTKEIGIRKVLGATDSHVLLILTRDFVQWIGLAIIITCPIAYFMVRKVLAMYAYRIRIGADLFLLPSAGILIIALLTVSVQAIRSARTKPVDALRYE